MSDVNGAAAKIIEGWIYWAAYHASALRGVERVEDRHAIALHSLIRGYYK